MPNVEFNEMCERFGYEYFGPFLFGFTAWLKKNIEKTSCKRVFFFSRDGYMMKRAYEMVSRHEYDLEYIHVSRQSLRQTLLYTANNYEESLQYITKERFVSIEKILKYYGFTIDECVCLEKKYSVNLKDMVLYTELAHDESIKTIYLDNVDLINSRSKKQADYLKKYLSQNNFQNDCAIVDIGWHGSMQFYLERFLEIQEVNAKIEGYYVGINPLDSLSGNVHGYIFEPQRSQKRKDILCFLGGYEKLFQSLEGSTIGYEEIDGIIKPVFLPYEYENNPDIVSTIQIWQDNAIKYIEDSKEDLFSVDEEKLTRKLINFGKTAPMWGIKMFKRLYIIDGGKQLFVSQKSILKYTLSEFKSDLSNSIWKTGFMKSVFKLPLPYFLLYRILRK